MRKVITCVQRCQHDKQEKNRPLDFSASLVTLSKLSCWSEGDKPGWAGMGFRENKRSRIGGSKYRQQFQVSSTKGSKEIGQGR